MNEITRSGFAHELKAPLATISLPAELLLRDLQDLMEGKQTLARLCPQMKKRLAGILRQVLKAARRIDAAAQRIPVPIDVSRAREVYSMPRRRTKAVCSRRSSVGRREPI